MEINEGKNAVIKQELIDKACKFLEDALDNHYEEWCDAKYPVAYNYDTKEEFISDFVKCISAQ